MLPANSIYYSWFCRISSGRWTTSTRPVTGIRININAPMTIGLIISRGIYSSIRRRLAATNPRPIASKFSLERIEYEKYRRTLFSEKKEEERKRKKNRTKSLTTISFRSYLPKFERIDSWQSEIGMKFSRNLGGSRRLRRREGRFFLDWQYSNERRKMEGGSRRGTIGGGREGGGIKEANSRYRN